MQKHAMINYQMTLKSKENRVNRSDLYQTYFELHFHILALVVVSV